MKRHRERGFTRVDALVTIIVITMIVTTSLAALVPAMNKARQAALRARCANQMKQISAAISMYADTYNSFLPWCGGKDPNYPPPFNCKVSSSCPSDETHPYTVYRGDNPNYLDVNGVPIPMRLACLYEEGIIDDASVFYCPDNQEPTYQYDSYVHPSPPNTSYEWGTLPQAFNDRTAMNQWVRAGYLYYPTNPNTSPKYTPRRYDELDAQIPYITDILIIASTSSWGTISHKTESGGYSLNALFKDGHVVYCKDRRLFSRNPNDTMYDFFKKIKP